MRLATTLNILFVALMVMWASTAMVLVALSNQLHQSHTDVQELLARVKAIEELQVQLLVYNYHGNLYSLTEEPIYRSWRDTAERRLEAGLREAWRYGVPEEDAPVVARIRTSVDEFMTVRAEAVAEGRPLADIMRQASPYLNDALVGMRALTRTHLERARKQGVTAGEWHRLARLWAVSMAGLLLMGVALFLWGIREKLYRPLYSIREAVSIFGRGDDTVRAPLTGPDELQDIAGTFNEVADSLSRQRANRTSFLASVAHDLRNPLTAMKAYLQILSMGKPLTDEKVAEILRLLERQTDRIDRMVGDFVDAARVESGMLELRLQDVDLRTLVAESVALFQEVRSLQELSVTLPDEPLHVCGDPTRIEQVINNLLSNAIKFSPRGGRIQVSAWLEAHWAVLSVADEGIGMTPTDMEVIFEPFQRSKGPGMAIPGSGLGLSVTRRIVEAHGGTISVASTLGEGTTFTVRLPYTE